MPFSSWVYDCNYVPVKMSLLCELGRAYQISEQEILEGTGVQPEKLASQFMRTSLAQFVRAYENFVTRVDDVTVPARMAAQLHLHTYGTYGYTLMSGPTIRDVVDNALRYHRLAGPIYHTRWQEVGEEFIWQLTDPVMPLQNLQAAHHILAMQICFHAVHMRDALGDQTYAPLRARMPAALRPFQTALETTLSCPIAFDAPSPALFHARTMLDRPTVFSHLLTNIEMRAQCDRQLAEHMATTGISHRIYNRVRANPAMAPTMTLLASEMNISVRSLRRLLSEEGSTYEIIVDTVRNSLARDLVAGTTMTIEAISQRTGYNEAANFRRAFRRWTGVSPKEFRALNGSLRFDSPESTRSETD